MNVVIIYYCTIIIKASDTFFTFCTTKKYENDITIDKIKQETSYF